MKKLISSFIILLVVIGIFTSCTPPKSNKFYVIEYEIYSKNGTATYCLAEFEDAYVMAKDSSTAVNIFKKSRDLNSTDSSYIKVITNATLLK